MQLINCKVEMELKSMKHSILASPGNENTDANSDNITIIRPCCHFISKKIKSVKTSDQRIPKIRVVEEI